MTLTPEEIERAQAARRDALQRQLAINDRCEREGRKAYPDELAELEMLRARMDEPQAVLASLELESVADRPQRRSYTPPAVPPQAADEFGQARRSFGDGRDVALRAVEGRSDVLSAPAGDRLVSLVERDAAGFDSEYVAAVADPAYERAFAKIITASNGASAQLDADEQRAVQRVGDAMRMMASLTSGTDSEGGFAVPLALDPTLILSSDGALNPIRQLASTALISVSEWAGLTSEGITSAFAPEGTEVGDNTPVLAQPKIKPEKAHSWIPFTIEIGQDWAGISADLATLFRDARDNLEAEKFISGAGAASNEPEGIVAGLDAGSVVATATAATFAVDDVYALQEAVPPRFQPRAQWLSANAIANLIYRFVGTGDPDEPGLFNADRSRLLGKPWHEVSTMSGDAATAGESILLYGDVAAGFKIVDRIGLTIELVPHLFGPNQRPTGTRGLYAYWRTSGAVIVDNAVRVLEVAA